MASPTYLAIDVMGGDESPHLFVSATLFFLKQNSHVSALLFGCEAVIQQAKQHPLVKPLSHRLQFIVADTFVAPEEKPSTALRQKKYSSMALALQAVADGNAQAALSAGNTGALMVMAKCLLGSLEGIERPAICKKMPVGNAVCYVLDLGANIAASANQLAQFALMGAALAEAEGESRVTVGLLNVGQEHQKGSEVLQQADGLLQQCTRYSYKGFVEGGALFDGSVNVVVCDGFTGNAALKACEGLTRYLLQDLKSYFAQSFWRKMSAVFLKVLAQGWIKQLNPAAHNGALLVGLNGVVIKSHGAADQAAFESALQITYEQARLQPHKLLAKWLEANQ